ncbi:hypothetical protein LCGC14_2238890 [marine sediment metagenome]|uniref:Uncharacterized protein n=1 Tax=marine sediment metagenome TaxID=412755 RepID=A0A0F9D673_9ZZZZ
MSNPINLTGSPHPDHEGINSYGIKCTVVAKDKMGPAMVRKFATDLLKSISFACVRFGAIDIGHIKAYIGYKGGFLYADTVGEQQEVVIKGKDAAMVSELTLTLNSVILGISEKAIKEATEEMLENALKSFGLTMKAIPTLQVKHEQNNK